MPKSKKKKTFQLYEPVCEKCWLGTHGGNTDWWDADEKKDFKRGYSVLCPHAFAGEGGHCARPRKPPPEYCPYKLEHAVGVALKAANAKR